MAMNIIIQPGEADYKSLVQRPQMPKADMDEVIGEVFRLIAEKGDQGLKELTKKFDKTNISSIKLDRSDLQKAYESLDPILRDAILAAKANIEKFHKAQLPQQVKVTTMQGVECVQKAVPIERVGIYIPGGTAPLFSTILMLAIPAKIAGCSQVVLCSPPTYNGKIHPAILAVAYICDIDEVMQVGGSQAIAAMALGTETIGKVSKICGPGNQYVTAAKEKAQQYGVAIDMPAGPSEVLVYAGEDCVPQFVAIDLLSQAEHGADSQVVCVTPDVAIAKAISEEVDLLVAELPRKDMAVAALANSFIIVENDIDQAFAYINAYAPEHLIIASDQAGILAERVINAGSVFLGNWCPESVGDYASGTNHTLPTYGWAKSYNGVNVDTFMRKITFQTVTREGLVNLAGLVVPMAEAEQLQAHANAVKIRLEHIK